MHKISDIASVLKNHPKGALLALDHGTKRIGVAVSDQTRTLAARLASSHTQNS